MKSYIDEYKSKLISAEKAASFVKSDWIVNYASFNLKPIEFDKALGARAGEPGLERVYVKLSYSLPPVPAVMANDPEQKTFQVGSWFFSALDRYMADKGLVDFLPLNYHDTNSMSYWPDKSNLARRGNIWCGQVGSMDKHGNFNFGVNNIDIKQKVLAHKENGGIVVVEVNKSIPTCLGGCEETVHISEVDYIIEGKNPPLFNVEPAEPSENATKIASFIMEEIHNGCCLQFGIGSLPNTIGAMIAESDMKDFGIQTEMFNNAMMELYEKGKITNKYKVNDKYKSTYAFALGNADLYEFVDNNPRLASCTVEYVNRPERISIQPNVISVNNLLEIDLLTQACSESVGSRTISGSGGQLDWVHGAFDSPGGKSFLAFESTYTDKQGKMHSRIKPMLTPGAVVTTPRHSIHWIVTEYGKTNLKGLSMWERVEELVRLAHPDFREDLIKEAEKMGIWKRTNRKPLLY